MLDKRRFNKLGTNRNEYDEEPFMEEDYSEYDYTQYTEESYLDDIETYTEETELPNSDGKVLSDEFMENLQRLSKEFHKLPEEERRRRLKTGLRRTEAGLRSKKFDDNF